MFRQSSARSQALSRPLVRARKVFKPFHPGVPRPKPGFSFLSLLGVLPSTSGRRERAAFLTSFVFLLVVSFGLHPCVLRGPRASLVARGSLSQCKWEYVFFLSHFMVHPPIFAPPSVSSMVVPAHPSSGPLSLAGTRGCLRILPQ